MYPTHATPYSLAPTPASGEVTRFPLKRSERTNQATEGRNGRDRCILALRLVLAGALIVAAATLNLLLAEPATNATDFADATVLLLKDKNECEETPDICFANDDVGRIFFAQLLRKNKTV